MPRQRVLLGRLDDLLLRRHVKDLEEVVDVQMVKIQ